MKFRSALIVMVSLALTLMAVARGAAGGPPPVGARFRLVVLPPSRSWRALAAALALLLGGGAALAQTAVSPPTLSSATVDGKIMTLTFDRNLRRFANPGGAAFIVEVAGVGHVRADGAYVLGSTVRLRLASPVKPGQAVTVTYYMGGLPRLPLQDTAGNQVAPFRSSVTNKTQPPNLPPGNRPPTVGGTLDRTQPIDAPPGQTVSVSLDDQVVFTDPDGGDTLAYSLSATRGDVYEELAISGDRMRIRMKAACELANLRLRRKSRIETVVTINARDPDGATAQAYLTFVTDFSSCPSLSMATATDNKLTLTYDGEPKAGWRPSADEFVVTVDTTRMALAATNPVAVSGKVVTLTLAEPVGRGQNVWVSHAPGANPVTAFFTRREVTFNSTNHAPVYEGRGPWPWPLDKRAYPGGRVLVYAPFSDLDGDALSFTVRADRGPDVVTTHYLADSQELFMQVQGVCALGRIRPALPGSFKTTVTLTATDPAGAATRVTVVGKTNWDAADCPVLTGAIVNGATLKLIFDTDAKLDRGAVLYGKSVADDFTVKVNEKVASLAATDPVAIGDHTVILTLSEPVTAGNAVTVSYRSDWWNPLQTVGRFEVESFSNRRVDNVTTDATAPVLRHAAVIKSALTLTYDENLDPESGPAGSAFTVSATPPNGSPRTISGTGTATISGATATVPLASAVREGETVTVGYTTPASNLLQDLAGNDAADFAGEHADNPTDDTPPTVESATMHGTQLTITFSEALDTGSVPRPLDFEVTIPGPWPLPVLWPVADIEVNGSAVTLTLGLAVREGGTVSVRYRQIGFRQLQDAAGNKVAAFSGLRVTHTPPVTTSRVASGAASGSPPTADAGADRERGVLKRTLAAVATRTLASAVGNIGTRFESAGPAAPEAMLAGHRLPLSAAFGRAIGAVGDCVPGGGTGTQWTVAGCGVGAARARTIGVDELLSGSTFAAPLSSAAVADPGGVRWGFWGRGDIAGFEGAPESDARYEGSTLTGWLGVDVRSGPWLGGLAVSHGSSEADFTVAGGEQRDEGGRLELTLTSLYPYLGWTIADGYELRAVFGGGLGEARHFPSGDAAEETGEVTMLIGSLGLRGRLVSVAGFELAARADAGLARVETAEGTDAIDSLKADTWRARAGLDAGWRLALGEHAALTPFVEVAGRYGGGDGLTGAGLETVGGARFTAPPVSIEARGRLLALHEQEGTVERGASLTARVTPGDDGGGLSLAVAPSVGAATGAADALWSGGMPHPPTPGGANGAALDARIGYGVVLPALDGVLTPFAETGLAAGGAHRLRIGIGFAATPSDLAVEVAGERRERPGAEPAHALEVDLKVRF